MPFVDSDPELYSASVTAAHVQHHVWLYVLPDCNIHGANMGPIWGRQDPGEPHVGPMNFVIWDIML